MAVEGILLCTDFGFVICHPLDLVLRVLLGCLFFCPVYAK